MTAHRPDFRGRQPVSVSSITDLNSRIPIVIEATRTARSLRNKYRTATYDPFPTGAAVAIGVALLPLMAGSFQAGCLLES